MLDLKKFKGMPKKVMLGMLRECICPTILKILTIDFGKDYIVIRTNSILIYKVTIYENGNIRVVPNFGCEGFLNLVKLYQFFKSKRILNED